MTRYLFALFLLFIMFGKAYGYEVRFQGVEDQDALDLLMQASQLIALKDSSPETYTGLKRRAENDVPLFHDVFQSLGYFNPKIDFAIEGDCVLFTIEQGPLYTLARYEIRNNPLCITLDDLDIAIGDPAIPSDILRAEETLLSLLEDMGYPLAHVQNREVFADQTTLSISVVLTLSPGPQCVFGDTVINGNADVSDSVIMRKIYWEAGKVYDPEKIEKTQNALEASGLFSSISILHGDAANEYNEITMIINVTERKHRSIGVGLSYTTLWGPGFLVEWENRNLYHSGEKLSLKANIWQRLQEVSAVYVKPDFYHRGQDLIWSSELQSERTLAFTDTSFSLSGMIQKTIHDHTRLSYGVTYKHIHDLRSDNRRQYDLGKIPLQVRWSKVNSILNPTQGCIASLKITPALQLFSPNFAYCTANLIGSIYYPVVDDESLVMAFKANLGSIWGAPRHAIPPSERFYAGSDTVLRGYRFLTVSPLKDHRKPIGGRSLMVYSFEVRMRTSETLGWVFFYDIGNVYTHFVPSFDKKVRQSVGAGVRYHTPVGPLRLDVAFPLNRRRHLDHVCEVYLSVGQAF